LRKSLKIDSEKETEFERFDDVMGKLLSVPHEKIAKALDKEKKEKKHKKNKRNTK
jgi:hypothetical protein